MIKELVKSIHRPKEVKALYRFKTQLAKQYKNEEGLDILAKKQDDHSFCYAALNKVSRSFAIVIQQLPEELKDAVCVFYLVLRALDTIEDDMALEDELKAKLLNEFHLKCSDEDFALSGVGDQRDYQILLENYPKVAREFQKLKPAYQETIRDITKRMAEGMAKFSDDKVVSLKDYDLYCHYVAGLVGIGLSKLFADSGYEDKAFLEMEELSNLMGLFLQKTNIIRDYHEDLEVNRQFWPQELWQKYTPDFSFFTKNPSDRKSLMCLNEHVNSALNHAVDSLTYMSKLKNEQVFRFCAIPQIMAIQTLAEVYNNPNVFTQNVKIRKGLTAYILLETKDMKACLLFFEDALAYLKSKIKKDTPLREETLGLIERIELKMIEIKG